MRRILTAFIGLSMFAGVASAAPHGGGSRGGGGSHGGGGGHVAARSEHVSRGGGGGGHEEVRGGGVRGGEVRGGVRGGEVRGGWHGENRGVYGGRGYERGYGGYHYGYGFRPGWRYDEHFGYRAGWDWIGGDWYWDGVEWVWAPRPLRPAPAAGETLADRRRPGTRGADRDARRRDLDGHPSVAVVVKPSTRERGQPTGDQPHRRDRVGATTGSVLIALRRSPPAALAAVRRELAGEALAVGKEADAEAQDDRGSALGQLAREAIAAAGHVGLVRVQVREALLVQRSRLLVLRANHRLMLRHSLVHALRQLADPAVDLVLVRRRGCGGEVLAVVVGGRDAVERPCDSSARG